uniref:Uncharacterized protein n=2 Tax=Tetraselmis sp. GSL018 TaxID=582737 RepID=A0A061R074_9CHLO|mmetsp:Transcript_9937/g.23718  ORF Transcript_9937/g.23718 Transcript_9937/m.23718 type:complete len:418 (-) Transcript_9937:135-1388(-)
MPRENKQLSQLVDAALVVKQDVHKRVELRERLERFSKRPPVFTEEDRMHFKSEGGMYELVNSEGRSLALAGVVPRQPSLKHKPSSAACRWRAGVSSGMAPRPGSVEWHVQRLGEPHQPAAGSRPSTVPISSLRPVRPTAAEISESLAYKPVPDEEDITAGMGLSSSDEEEPEGSDGPLPEHDSEAAHKGPSRSPTATRQQSPPQPPPRPASRGRDLLQQQREERDAAMRREAVSRQNSGGVIFERLSGARPPWGAAHAMPAATEWDRRQSSPLRSLGKTTEFSGEGQALGGSRGAMGWSWAEGWASGPGSPDASRPATAWVSPFTSRPVSPLARPRSQALGTRDSGWSRRHPGEGAPVWASIHRRLKPRSAAASPGQLTHFPPAPRQSGRRSPGSRGRQRRTTARSATYRALPRAEN